MPRTRHPVFLALALAALAGCASQKFDPAAINPGATDAVRYATSRVSPAVVRLDVVTEEFAGGAAKANRGIGSGVIIDKEGHVLTNFHVAGRAKRIDITLANLEHVRATLVGSDHWTDLALVKLDMEEVKRRHLDFAVAELGGSSTIELGQPVMAIGTPYGLTRTVTMGIISNTDRFFAESSIEGYETGWFNNWIQTDAAINPGNSGGPLVNLKGQVIGINTRGTTTGNNLGFAIPIDVAKQVIAQIMDHKKVLRSYIGVQLQPLQDLEKFYDASQGCLIRSVDTESPAARQGIQPEDILVAVNDTPVTVRFPEQLAYVRKMIADQPIGSTIKLTIQRSGKTADRKVVAVTTERLESVVTEEKAITAWGMTVRNVTRAYLREKRLPFVEGVLVTSVRDGSPAQSAGMRDDDIVLRVENVAVTSTEELEEAVKRAAKAGKPVAVDIRRDRSEKVLVIKPHD